MQHLRRAKASNKRLRWSRGSVLAFSTQVRRIKPGRSYRIFKGEKILSTPSFGGEVKPLVPCCRFTACKRTLKCSVEVDIIGKITGQFLTHKSFTFPCLDLSHCVGHGDIWRRKWEWLEQGEHNKPPGCSPSRAYAPGPDYEQEEERPQIKWSHNFMIALINIMWFLQIEHSHWLEARVLKRWFEFYYKFGCRWIMYISLLNVLAEFICQVHSCYTCWM